MHAAAAVVVVVPATAVDRPVTRLQTRRRHNGVDNCLNVKVAAGLVCLLPRDVVRATSRRRYRVAVVAAAVAGMHFGLDADGRKLCGGPRRAGYARRLAAGVGVGIGQRLRSNSNHNNCLAPLDAAAAHD